MGDQSGRDHPPRVFISYTHDSESHQRRIGELAERLRADDIDARIDRFITGTPPGGWPSWMEDELESADFIVLICTSTYEQRYRQQGDTGVGLGGRWESSLVRDLLYSDPAKIGRFIPVLPRNGQREDIPLPLRVRATHYQLGDYDGLLAHLTGREMMPELGSQATTPVHDLRSRRRVEAPASESRSFSPSITEQYLRINRRILSLTEEQYAVITQLQGRPRALISGTPGSGKTLVAAEKATRLAHAGIKTLFLCHNPLLAEWVGQLTKSAAVDVRAFEDLIRELAPGGNAYDENWTSYSEPTSQQLDAALEALLDGGTPPYEAVIVDEGQDFADDWWQLVEACLPGGSEATLYIFFDERQSLLRQRLNLPPSGWPLTLSRNCRNAGRVYDVMRRLAPGSPLPDEELHELGEVGFFRAAKLRDAVVVALHWCHELEVLHQLAVVLGGGVEFESSVLAKGPFTYEDEVDWRELVRREMRNLTRYWAADLRKGELDPEELWGLRGFSTAKNPTRADVALMKSVASRLAAALPPDQAAFHRPDVRWLSNRVYDTGAVIWRLGDRRRRINRTDILNALRCDVWLKSLPRAAAVRFAPHRTREPGQIPVYTVADIKGLERDAILLVMQGDAPQFMQHLFVGVSRPRAVLAVVGDDRTYAALPSQLV